MCYVLQELQNHKEVSATSYNKPGNATRGPPPDGKAKKEILV
jgi:hypothetical protein